MFPEMGAFGMHAAPAFNAAVPPVEPPQAGGVLTGWRARRLACLLPVAGWLWVAEAKKNRHEIK